MPKITGYSTSEISLVEGAKAFAFGNKHDEKASDFNDALNEALAEEELMKLRWAISDALYDTIDEITKDDATSMDEKISAITLVYSQYSAAMVSWWSKMLALNDDDVEDADVETKEGEEPKDVKKGAALSTATKNILNKCVKMHTEACDMHSTATKLTQKAVSKHKDAIIAVKALTGSQSADEYPNAPDKVKPKKGQTPDQPQPPVNDPDPQKEFRSLIETARNKMSATK